MKTNSRLESFVGIFHDDNKMLERKLRNHISQHEFISQAELFISGNNELKQLNLTDTFYYEITCSLTHLLSREFMEKVIRPKDQLFYGISSFTPLDHCNAICIAPSKKLILSIDKDTHESLGLIGQRVNFRHHSNDRFIVVIDLIAKKFQPGNAYYDRVLWCLSEERIGSVNMKVWCENAVRNILIPIEFPPDMKNQRINCPVETITSPSHLYTPSPEKLYNKIVSNLSSKNLNAVHADIGTISTTSDTVMIVENIAFPSLTDTHNNNNNNNKIAPLCYGIWEWLGIISCRLWNLVTPNTVATASSDEDMSSIECEFLSGYSKPIDLDYIVSQSSTAYRYIGGISSNTILRLLEIAKNQIQLDGISCVTIMVWGDTNSPTKRRLPNTSSTAKLSSYKYFNSGLVLGGNENDYAIVLFANGTTLLYTSEAV